MRFKTIMPIFMLVMLFLAPTVQMSASNQAALKLVLHNGMTASFLLSEQPVLSFENDLIVVTSSTVSASYQLSDVKEYYFVELSNSVDNLQKDEVRFVRQANDEVIIYGIPTTGVDVYDLSGRRQTVTIQQQGNALSVSLRQLPATAYIIRLNHQSIKLIKK